MKPRAFEAGKTILAGEKREFLPVDENMAFDRGQPV